eukprot:248543-Lingulodinium_polyedra.AAC.1
MVSVLCGPIFDSHSTNAREVRGPAETLHFYCSAAKGSWVKDLHQVTALLMDIPALTHLGFTTDFANLGKKVSSKDPWVQSEDSLAAKALDLVLALVHKRASSMLWHSGSWPGLLALLQSQSKADRVGCLQTLLQDFQVWLECQDYGNSDNFLKSLAKNSPFATTWMNELGKLVAGSPNLAEDDQLLEDTQKATALVWMGWGQTKVVEDAFQCLRSREDSDSRHKVLKILKQWDVLRSRE